MQNSYLCHLVAKRAMMRVLSHLWAKRRKYFTKQLPLPTHLRGLSTAKHKNYIRGYHCIYARLNNSPGIWCSVGSHDPYTYLSTHSHQWYPVRGYYACKLRCASSGSVRNTCCSELQQPSSQAVTADYSASRAEPASYTELCQCTLTPPPLYLVVYECVDEQHLAQFLTTSVRR